MSKVISYFTKLSWEISLIFLALGSPIHAQITPPAQDYILRFGGNQIAVVPDNSLLDMGEEFTFECWIYPERSKDVEQVIMGHMHDAWSMAYGIRLNSGLQVEMIIADHQSGNSISALSAPITIGQWLHIAGILGNDTLRLYLDGVEVDKQFCDLIPSENTTPFSIGAGMSDPGYIFEDGYLAFNSGFYGSMRQVRIWSKDLSPLEINTYSTTILKGIESGLVACWPLDDHGDVVLDTGPNKQAMNLGLYESIPETPIWTTPEVIDNPYFKIKSTIWMDSIVLENPEWRIQDIHPIDFDSDTNLDIVLSYTTTPTHPPTYVDLHSLRNIGNGSFENVSNEILKNAKVVLPRHYAIEDFNNDGLMDFYIGESGSDAPPFGGGQNQLFLQLAEGNFENVTSSNIPSQSEHTHNVAYGDIDNDGDQDIFELNVCCGDLDDAYFLINDGNGKFTKDLNRIPTEIVSIHQVAFLSSLLVDVDKDGDLDLFLGGPYSPETLRFETLLLNDGKGYYEFASNDAMPTRLTGEMGYTPAAISSDLNGDGWLDIILATDYVDFQGGEIQLLINNKNGAFSDGSPMLPEVTGLGLLSNDNYAPWIIWNRIADFNGDGWMDILSMGDAVGVTLLLNNEGAEFIDATFLLSPILNGWDTKVETGDFDQDGDIDIFSVSFGEYHFVENVKPFETGTKLDPPGIPMVTFPTETDLVFSSHNFKWNENGPTINFDIQISLDSNFENIVYQKNQISTTEWSVEDLNEDLDYFWRLRGYNTAGYGEWSPAHQFRVSVLGTIDEQGNKVRLYPNPAFDFVIIEWNNFERATISELSGKQRGESNTRTLDLRTLSAGVYLITLHGTNNERITFRIIKE